MHMKGGVYLGTSQKQSSKGQTAKKPVAKSKPKTEANSKTVSKGSRSANGTSATKAKSGVTDNSNRKQPAGKNGNSNQEVMVMKPEKSLLRYEIELISLFALTLLSAVAIHTEWTGFFGKLMKGIYLGLFGFSGVTLTYAIFLLVFFNINKFFKDKKWRLVFAVICTFFSVWIFSTAINYSTFSTMLADQGQLLMSSEGWKLSFEQGIQLRGGGVLGNILVFGIINGIGKFGAYLLGTLFAAFAVVLAFKVSLTNLVKRSGIHTYNGIKPIAEKMTHLPKIKPREKKVESPTEKVQEETLKEGELVTSEDRITLSDLPRMEKPIEAYNSDLYFDPAVETINLETGEYIQEETGAAESATEVETPEPSFIANFMNSVEEVVEDIKEDIQDAHIDDELGLDTSQEDLADLFVHFSSEEDPDDIFEAYPEDAMAEFEPSSSEFKDAFEGDDLAIESVPLIKVQEIVEDILPIAEVKPRFVVEPTPIPVAKEIPKPAPKPIPKPYIMPPLTLLNPAKAKTNNNRDEIIENVKTLEVTLKNFGVDAKVTEVTKGPAITMYEVLPAPGVKVSKIVNLTDDIALALAASQIRIIAPIPGKSAIGIEIPNKDTTMVTAREVFESDEFRKTDSKLSFALGKEITGKTMVADLAKMPHLLIAGSTGSGKSVCVNTIINSILFNAKPDEVKLLMIDPKVVELSHYNGIPHLILPVVVDPKKASIALNWAVNEMGNRYKTFAEHVVKDINSYNRKAETQPELNLEKMPKIVILVDELADLMMAAPNQVEDAICRLAQMARAAGIHLIVATQRPSVDVITGLIKANIPSRIAFAVSSQIDSRTILDMAGAEKLLGKGDMLFYPLGANKPVRIQGAFLADSEVEDIVEFVKKQVDGVEYQEEILADVPETASAMEADELLKDAVELVVETGQASISMLQRKFRVGYNRAARLVDQMEERGIVGPSLGSKPREVLLTRLELEQLKL